MSHDDDLDPDDGVLPTRHADHAGAAPALAGNARRRRQETLTTLITQLPTNTHVELDDVRDDTYKHNLESTLTHARDVAHELNRAHDLADGLDQAIRYGREHGFDELFATALTEALGLLKQATTDFAGADLAAVDLDGVPLQGLRWSSTTQWPPGWEEPIRQASVQLKADLYEIRDDPRIRSHLT